MYIIIIFVISVYRNWYLAKLENFWPQNESLWIYKCSSIQLIRIRPRKNMVLTNLPVNFLCCWNNSPSELARQLLGPSAIKWVKSENTLLNFILSFTVFQLAIRWGKNHYDHHVNTKQTDRPCQWLPLQVALVKYSWYLVWQVSLLKFWPQMLTTLTQ